MPTRKTLYWAAAATILYMIAWNVGAGWLYVLTTFLISLALVSIILSRVNIGGIGFSLDAPRSATAGERQSAVLEVANRSLLPKFLLDIRLDFAGSRHLVFLPALAPRGKRAIKIELNDLRRGIYPGGEVRLSSSGPVGLARSRRHIRVTRQIVVYPSWQQLGADWSSGQKNAGYMVSSAIPTRNTASDYLGVRDYRPGDSPRSIHWRTSARTGSLSVIEYARQAAITPVFLVDTFTEADRGKEQNSTFETAVTIAASLAQRESRQNRRFGIGSSPSDAAGRGLGHEPHEAMLWLAGVESDSEKPMDLSRVELPWPEVTPVLLLTGHSAYARLERSDLLQDHPHSIVIMLDGRNFEKGGRPGLPLMDDIALERLGEHLDSLGAEFFLIASGTEVQSCLSGL